MRNANKEITKKHDHSLTNLLKGALFSLVMLAPIFSIAVRCGYVMFNKNAYESYYGETINESETLIANNHYVIGKEYTLTIGNKAYTEQNEVILNVSNVSSEQMTGINIENTNNIHIRSQNGNTYALFYNGTTYITDRNFLITNPNTVKFTYLGSNNVNLNSNYVDTITYIEYNNYSYLDNAFTYGISNLKNETVFNWTQNTALYTPINAMCTGLGITEEAIAIMLTYWALITAIYIIFDIIIVLFTKLTHLLN